MLCKGNHLAVNYRVVWFIKIYKKDFFLHMGKSDNTIINHNHKLYLQAYEIDPSNYEDPMLQSQELKVDNQPQAKIIRLYNK